MPALKGRKLQLHRIQRNGSDEVVKAIRLRSPAAPSHPGAHHGGVRAERERLIRA
jgi:hypothetical protein